MRAHEFIYESMLLLEDRIDFFKTTVVPRIEKKIQNNQLDIPRNLPSTAEQLFQWIVDQDPTQNKEYTRWLLNIAFRKKNPEPLDNLVNIKTVLTQFHSIKTNLTKAQKNIDSYSTIDELKAVIDQYDSGVKHSIQSEKNKALSESNVVVKTSEWFIVQPKTEFASQYWGRGSKWCTAYGDPKGLYPDRTCAFEEYYNSLKFDIITCINLLDRENSVQIGLPTNLETSSAGDAEIKNTADEPINKHKLVELRMSAPPINAILNDFEKKFCDDPYHSFEYAYSVLEMPWYDSESDSAYDAEFSIATSSEYVALYAIDVIGDLWEITDSPVARFATETIESHSEPSQQIKNFIDDMYGNDY